MTFDLSTVVDLKSVSFNERRLLSYYSHCLLHLIDLSTSQMSVCCEVSGATMAAPVSQDNKDSDYLEKLIKFFALKSAQIIVQARLGGKVHTACNPASTQTDWVSSLNILLTLTVYTVSYRLYYLLCVEKF